MATVKAAAVQAAYVLMNQQATLDKAIGLIEAAAAQGAQIVVFPEVFIPGTPIWIDSRPIWDGDEQWFAMLAAQAVVVPGPVTDALGAAARAAGTYVVMGVEEREPHGSTIYNTTLYLGPDGALLGKHRKLMPTGSERTVWGMGDGSTLPVVDTPYGRLQRADLLGELHAAGPVLPVLAGRRHLGRADPGPGDAWVASMRHIAREGRCYVIGVNPCVHRDQIPADFPRRERTSGTSSPTTSSGSRPGNSVIVAPSGEILAGPARHEETILTADLDLDAVRSARRLFDPVGHYNRPDVFHLAADLRARPAVDGHGDVRPTGRRAGLVLAPGPWPGPSPGPSPCRWRREPRRPPPRRAAPRARRRRR